MENLSRHDAILLVAVLLLHCLAAAGSAIAAESAMGEPGQGQNITLSRLGYPAGLLFAEDALPQRYTVKFPLPQDLPLAGATLHLRYRATTELPGEMALSVTINDQVITNGRLEQDGASHEWLLPIGADKLSGGQLTVTLQGVLPENQQSCRNGQRLVRRLRLLPSSYLQTSFQGSATSMRDLWLMLPQEVTLTLPAGTLDESLFATALEWVALLQRQHHTVRISRLPHLGDVVIAPHNAILKLLDIEGRARETLWSGRENIGVLNYDNRRIIAITAPYPSAERFAAQWYELRQAAFIPDEPVERGSGVQQISLASIDVDTLPARIGHKLQWFGTITPWRLPPGTSPVAALLKLQLPTLAADDLLRLYVYLDDHLVKSELLPRGEGTYQTLIEFDERRADNNYRLHLVVRSAADADCAAVTASHTVRIDESSHLLLADDESEVTQLSALPTALGHGFDLLVPQLARDDAAHYLPLLARLLNGFAIPHPDYSVIFVDDAQPLAPQRRFIAVGGTLPEKVDIAMRFDLGRLELDDRHGSLLLNDEQLQQMTILQLTNIGGHSGLWVHPGRERGLPALDVAMLGGDDVAIYAADHKVISFEGKHADLAHSRYADLPSWSERMIKARLNWLFAGWVLLTLGVLYLYLKSRQHRRK